MDDRKSRRAGRLAALAAVAVAGALLLAPFPEGLLGGWQGELFDFGHVPLFAFLVLTFRAGMGPPLWRPLLTTIAVAGLVEIVQPLVGRTGNWADFLRGCLGAFAAGSAFRAWESRRTRLRAFAYVTLAIGLLVWPVMEVTPYVADTVESHRTFPVLATFSTDYEFRRWTCGQATLSRYPDRGGRVEFLTGPDEYPGVALRPGNGNFGSHRWLCAEFQVVGAPLELVISVRTGRGGASGTTHTDIARTYAGATHIARLDLAAMASQGRPEPLELSDVRSVIFFLVRPRESRTIILKRVWLEA
jgi:hypothetical protein